MNFAGLPRRVARRLLPGRVLRAAATARGRAGAVRQAAGPVSKLRIALLGSRAMVQPQVELPGAGSTVSVRVNDLDGAAVELRPRSRDLQAFELVFDEGLHLPPPEVDGPLARIAVFGADIGLPLADLAVRYPTARLLGVEPDPDNAALARANVADAGDRATIVEAAVWHCDAELEITWAQDARGLDRADAGTSDADTRTVTAVDAGRLLREFAGGHRVDYLLVTVGSAWYELLRHGEWARDVGCIKIEVQDRYDEAVLLLERLGFRARMEYLERGAFAIGVRDDRPRRAVGRVSPYVERARRSARWRRDAARDRAAQVRALGERKVIARTSRRTVPTSRILCYHTVGMPSLGVNDVSLRRLERQLQSAMDAGYRFVPAAELAADPLPEVPGEDLRLAITFDDGFRSILTTVEPLLRGLSIPWTAFVVSGFADGRKGHDDFLDWHEIARLAESGVTIASHSVTHPNFRLLSGGQVVDELEQSRTALREKIGIDTPEFAIPFGQSGNWTPAARAAAESAGYHTVYAQSVERRPDGTVPRTFVTKFDDDRIFRAALAGAFDRWEEWF